MASLINRPAGGHFPHDKWVRLVNEVMMSVAPKGMDQVRFFYLLLSFFVHKNVETFCKNIYATHKQEIMTQHEKAAVVTLPSVFFFILFFCTKQEILEYVSTLHLELLTRRLTFLRIFAQLQ